MKVIMSEKQKRVIGLLQSFSPKDFGVRQAFYRIKDDKMEVVFVVNKNNAPNIASYLNSLSSLVEEKVGGITVESSVYIREDGKNEVRNVAKRKELKEINLFRTNNIGVGAVS